LKKHYALIIDDPGKVIFSLAKKLKSLFASDGAVRVFNMTGEKFYHFKSFGNLWKAPWLTTGKSDLVPFEKLSSRRLCKR
jgi:hypothetical protein